MEDVLVPIAFFAAVILGIWLISLFNYRKRQTVHETLRHAFDSGQPVSMEFIERLSLASDPARSDLRRGVLFIASGLALALLGFLISREETEALFPLLGVSTFPILLGIAYLGLWRFASGRTET